VSEQLSSVLQKFFELAAEAERIDTELMDEPVEPAFEAVLSHVLEHPEARTEIAKAFLQIACDPDKGPPELIQYCMHALRWDEVKNQLVDWLNQEKSERVRQVFKKILIAFDDNWYDADSYARFSN